MITLQNQISKEVWKDIPKFEGLYQVNNLTVITRLDAIINFKDGKRRLFKAGVLKPRLTNGYFRVPLSKDGIKKSYLVHRLFALAFIPNPQNKPCINHKNGIKTDNRIENLEWCTSEENNAHAWTYGLMKKNSGDWQRGKYNAEHNSKPVLQMDINGNLVKSWPSIGEVSRQLGFFKANVSACALGKTKSAYGFKWMYAKAG